MLPDSTTSHLTARQAEILAFLHHSRELNGLMPSTREIQEEFGFSSQTAAMDVLRALERKGVLHRLPGVARGIILKESPKTTPTAPPPSLTIPLRGYISAGYANDSAELTEDSLHIDPATLGLRHTNSYFALQVHGDSMVNAHILDGDFVIFDSAKTPRHFDIVAALIDGETTLKRLMVAPHQRWLKAENPRYPDLFPTHSLEVQGVMQALIRTSTG